MKPLKAPRRVETALHHLSPATMRECRLVSQRAAPVPDAIEVDLLDHMQRMLAFAAQHRARVTDETPESTL